MDNTFKNLPTQNLPNKIHKEIIDKDGVKLTFNISAINEMREKYIDLSVHKYNEEKEKYIKEKKSFDIKRDFVFGLISISILLMIISIFALNIWILFAGILLFVIGAIIGFVIDNPKKDSYGILSGRYEKYYEANMDEQDIFKIYNLEKTFNALEKINKLDTTQPIKIKVKAGEINILYIDKNKTPKTLRLNDDIYFTTSEAEQSNYFEFKDVENVEITNYSLYALNIILPIKYSERYRELVE